jgi:hypothetical protein
MGKNSQLLVRSHAQEREWLLHLGDGNIIAGVQYLIRQQTEKANINFINSLISSDPLRGHEKGRRKHFLSKDSQDFSSLSRNDRS